MPTFPLPRTSSISGAKQLSKLKRFLTTLQQFASDISPDIGDQVRHLVLALVNAKISVEAFHAQLQELTNFPLRPFIIEFLKNNLFLLQAELIYFSRVMVNDSSRITELQTDSHFSSNFKHGQDCSPTLWNLKSEPTSVKRPMDKNENRTTKRKLEIKVDTSADSFLKVKIAHEMPSAYVHFQTPSTTSFSNNFASMNKLIQNTFGQIPASTTHLHSGFTSDFYNPISYNEMLRSFNSNLESSSNANQKNCNSGLEFGEQYSNWLSQFTNVLNENAVDISKDEVKVRLNAY